MPSRRLYAIWAALKPVSLAYWSIVEIVGKQARETWELSKPKMATSSETFTPICSKAVSTPAAVLSLAQRIASKGRSSRLLRLSKGSGEKANSPAVMLVNQVIHNFCIRLIGRAPCVFVSRQIQGGGNRNNRSWQKGPKVFCQFVVT